MQSNLQEAVFHSIFPMFSQNIQFCDSEIKQISLEQQVTLRYYAKVEKERKEEKWFPDQYCLCSVRQIDGVGMLCVDMFYVYCERISIIKSNKMMKTFRVFIPSN